MAGEAAGVTPTPEPQPQPIRPRRNKGGPQYARSVKKLEVIHRQHRVCELYLQGKYQHEIAKELGVSIKTVTRDLKAVEAIWLASAVTNFDKMRAEELARINLLERTYYRAWKRSLRSKEDSVSGRTTTGRGDEVKEATKAEIRRRQGEGNPAFLAGVERCSKARREMFGLDRATGGANVGVMVLNAVDMEVMSGRRPHPNPEYAAERPQELNGPGHDTDATPSPVDITPVPVMEDTQ